MDQMAQHRPTVSIGLPVYNGENYLAKTIRSILGQTYTDFELIICDNASTDGTQQICEEFARSDPRVRYARNERNLGAGPNYDLAFRRMTTCWPRNISKKRSPSSTPILTS